MLRLLIEDVTLVGGEMIQVHVRLRGGATRSMTLDKPLPIAQLRKTKPEVSALMVLAVAVVAALAPPESVNTSMAGFALVRDYLDDAH